MALRILVVISLLCLLAGHVHTDEPKCNSRFDYEYKVIKKLVMLEEKQEELHRIVEDQNKKISHLTDKLSDASATNQELQTTLGQEEYFGGKSYIRWGRSQCPGDGTHRVYHGYAGGSKFTDTGGAAGYLCLPSDPLWGHFTASEDDAAAFVYGAEYELTGRDRTDFFKKELFNHNAPCAVCQTRRRDVIMIPGRTRCYDDWTEEYKGYLVGGSAHHSSATEFVCLDEDAEPVSGGHNDENGKLFYFAEVRCGSLKCPPYVHGRELACVVCSK